MGTVTFVELGNEVRSQAKNKANYRYVSVFELILYCVKVKDKNQTR